MVISDERVTSNAKKFFEVGKKKGFINDDLITFLGADFVNAPASTRKEYVGSYRGGLIETSLQIAKQMINSNKNLREDKRVDEDSIMKVAFLHQIGKARLFVPAEEWQIKRGQNYDFNENLVSMRVSERSLFYATSNGIKFTEEEFQAIINYDKSSDDKQSKIYNSSLGKLLRIGNEMIEIEKI